MARPTNRALRDTLAALNADPVSWVAGAVLCTALVPYVMPGIPPADLYDWRWIYSDIPVAVAVLLAVWWGSGRVESAAERTFWRLMVVARSVVLVIEVANAAIPNAAFTPQVEIAVYSGYLIFYMVVLLAAAASRGYLASHGVWKLQRVRLVGLGVLGVTVLVYFEAVPYVVDPTRAGSWHPGLFLYTTFDLVIALVFLRIARAHTDRRWIGILTGFAAIFAWYSITDTAEVFLLVGRFAETPVPSAWDLAWYVPEILFLVVARRYLAVPAPSAEPPPAPPMREDRGLILVALLSFPSLHVVLYQAGVLDPALRGERDGVVGAFLLGMGLLTLHYFRLAEREQRRSQRELTLSEERYRTFVRLRSEIVCRGEIVPPVEVTAPASEQIRAVSAAPIVEVGSGPDVDPLASDSVGTPITSLLPEREREAFLTRWIASGYRDELESVAVGASGSPKCFRYALTGIVEHGRLHRVWLTRSDITELKQATSENRRLAEELEHARKLESLGRLAGGIAHDFNNLLAPIVGYTELARGSIGQDDDDARDSLGQVLSAAGRAADLVEQVLSVSRQQPRTTVFFYAQDTAHEVARLLKPGLPSRISVAVSADPTCPPTSGDPSRIHQVVMNLCVNAAQAIGDDAGRIEIEVTHEAEPLSPEAPLGRVRIDVRDDGPGIPPDVAAKAFDPFYTTKPVGRGTGLGLSVVRGIVISHGGRVEIDSTPDAGTVVSVYLPAAEARAASAHPSTPAQADRSGAPDDEGPQGSTAETPDDALSVLVVDDEVPVGTVVRRHLAAVGHTVRAERDPRRALEVVDEAADLDLLVTDLSMPGMTGTELIEQARRRNPALAVVLMTGYDPDPVAPLPDIAVLRKPFTRSELLAAIATSLESVARRSAHHTHSLSR